MLKLQQREQPDIFVKLAFSTVTLGRDESNDLLVDSPSVSDFHAEVTSEAHRYYIKDLLSASGTFVNDERISEPCELNAWDVIRLGSVELEINDPGKCRPGDWALRTESNLLASQFYALRTETVIGRDSGCDISIENSMLSRRHAKLIIDNGRLRVLDLKSANGTFINGERVEQGFASPGDRLRFDEQEFVVVGPSETQLQVVDDGSTQMRFLSPLETPAAAPEPQEANAPPVEIGNALFASASAAKRNTQGTSQREASADVAPVSGPEPEPTSSHKSASEVEPNSEPVPQAPVAVELNVEPESIEENPAAIEPPVPTQVAQNSTPLPAASEETCLLQSVQDEEETQFLGSAPTRAAASLVECSKLLAEPTITLEPGDYLLGRSPQSAIVLPDASVSRQHAKLAYLVDHWALENLGGRNGVQVNGAMVEQVRLQNGDRITLGRIEFEFNCDNESENDQLVTAYYESPQPSADATLQVPKNKRPDKAAIPFGLYGLCLLLLAFGGAVLIYLWRTGGLVS